ncbi:unnamed protein product [Malus baccata var. baccata]
MGFIFAQGLPSGVWCASSVLSYCFVSYFRSPPTANSRTWILDNCGRIEISSPKMILGRFDAARLLLDEPEWPERSLSSQLQVKTKFRLKYKLLGCGIGPEVLFGTISFLRI